MGALETASLEKGEIVVIEWLGISHLFELSGMEAIAGFLTPLVVFIAFFVAQLVIPARRVPGYVIDAKTGAPRDYRLNGLVIFLIAIAVWAIEPFGMEREWFYKSSVYAVAGGTVLCAIFATIAFWSQPQGEEKNWFLAWWHGRALEHSFINNRVDFKMYLYVVGGTMLVLNALSGAAYHHDQFGDDANPGVYVYAAFFTFYIFDYFIFERVQLYTYDLIHENLGFKLIWGGLIIYGWLYILPLWGMAERPAPDYSPMVSNILLGAMIVLFLFGWSISRAGNLQKYWFKRWPDRKFLGIIEQKYIVAGDRKILYSGIWGVARHFNYMGEGFLALSVALVFGYPANLWAWTYMIFIVSLFTWRQFDDDKVCEEKYGTEKWNEYKQRVKYRLFPGIY